MKKLGILLYIDDSKEMLEDFSWIYKSWIFSKNYFNSDLIAVCHPNVVNNLPSEPGIIKLIQSPYSDIHIEWKNYKFINSIACLCGPEIEMLADKYEYFLRTDADVFLTSHLVNFYPNRPVHGRGLYANPIFSTNTDGLTDLTENDVWTKIIQFANKHGYKHHRVHNCGHSLLAKPEDVLFFLREQLKLTKLLKDEFDSIGGGKWPGWYGGVITMYAAEIVANHYFERYLRNAHLNILDRESYLAGPIDCLTLHIHAIHTHEYFSKHKFREGKYKDININKIDISKINNYAHYICQSKVSDIKYAVNYPY
jgi:hypothetical protein